jgi:hypothetical protein
MSGEAVHDDNFIRGNGEEFFVNGSPHQACNLEEWREKG